MCSLYRLACYPDRRGGSADGQIPEKSFLSIPERNRIRNTSAMKRVLLLILFFSSLKGFSQNSKTDTLETIEELKALRSQIAEKIDQLRNENKQVQVLLDSCNQKVRVQKDQLARLKSKGAAQSKQVKQLQDEIAILESELINIGLRQAAIQELIAKASNLMNEIDEKIEELLKGSEMMAFANLQMVQCGKVCQT